MVNQQSIPVLLDHRLFKRENVTCKDFDINKFVFLNEQ